ncbi:COP9 signalosome complex subunit 3 [Ceratocystis fimbriata CBS 114723]|uniref:COP9 signalosome complex subunit 3 n=1 Tax=Ceratocystis fimbriata CBS 114723 TaxID=1035309 RepID=A0A2C5XI41_9PEZI|nr:COP9 signalosome complex subunit 3 [Ceratocystis fimbriata CBS 114723]
MEELIRQLQSFPLTNNIPLSDEQYDILIKSHIRKLSRASIDQATSDLNNIQQLLNAIKALDPAVHSASFGLVLEAALRKLKSSAEFPIASELLKFTALFDPIQIRYIGSSLVNILDTILDLDIFSAPIATDAVATALCRLNPEGTYLNSTRIRLAKVAYQTCTLDAVMPLISLTPLYFPCAAYPPAPYLCSRFLTPPEYMASLSKPLLPQDIMEYDMTCGLVFCAQGKWKAARSAFSRCVTHPFKNGDISKIAVEAFKRWILTSLIVLGSVNRDSVPNPCPHLLRKALPSLAQPYIDLAEAFAKDYRSLQSKIDSHSAIWPQDNNLGLVNMVVSYYPKWKIGQLRSIYTKCSITEVQESLSKDMLDFAPNSSQIIALIEEMASENMLTARVVAAEGDIPDHVVFTEPSKAKSSAELKKQVDECMHNIRTLQEASKDINTLIQIHPDYVQVFNDDIKHRKVLMGTDGVQTDFDMSMEDEDLMAGISTTA